MALLRAYYFYGRWVGWFPGTKNGVLGNAPGHEEMLRYYWLCT